jgi:hypothetical protein
MQHLLGRLILAALIGGGVLMYFAYQEWRVGSGAASAPEDIKLADLIARGPTGNPYVRVSDFDTGNNFVYQEGNAGGSWETVWVPAAAIAPGAATDQPEADIKNPQVIIKSKHVHSESELAPLLQRPTLDGLVTNRIESLGSEEKKQLTSQYPGVDFDKCLILDEGRKPSGLTSVALMGGGGLILFLGSGAFAIRGWTRRRA